MLFLKCESFDYDFEAVIFPKDVEKYEDKLDINKIIIISGALNVNLEYKRKSIQTRELKVATITMVRDQGRELGLMDDKKRFTNLDLNQVQESEVQREANHALNTEESSETLEEKIQENKAEKSEKIREKYIVDIPSQAQKQDLQELKEYLLMQSA